MTTAAGGVLLVGCGKMGGALLNGWIEGGRSPATITVVEPEAANFARATSALPDGIVRVESPHALSGAARPEAIVLAVKPQSMDDVVPQYRRFGEGDAVFVSIAAGKPIKYYSRALGRKTPVVRAMPNTPAAIGRGITAAIANPYVSPEQHAICHALLGAVGEVVWLTDEAGMDAVTAVSGSGPAYVFLLVEAMTAAGVAAGLPAETAARLARATVCGAGELMHLTPDEPATLRKNVTSPGGTTEAALKVLMAEDGLKALMTKAIAAAAARSHELAS
jgi:pyrroline-5-carboxylate reductase